MIEDSAYSPQMQGLVDDDIERLRHRIASEPIVSECSVGRSDPPHFVVVFNEGRVPNGFFESYNLQFKECMTMPSGSLLKFLFLGERWVKAIGVPENGLFDGDADV